MPVLLSSSGGSYRSFPSCVFLIVLEKLVVAQVHWQQIAVGAEVGADGNDANSMKRSCDRVMAAVLPKQ
ncbi:hypothetical protein [Mesorhizobium sp.]|jgi:hypothetical protein|uniref:hypothetical protein n=1 Tax=Mesorhizobium sp. TaxID=1871066 RepID=UPI000FE36F0D|nr:hypothetical protein [Mesorhizobium sp.]RWO01452.1 MAG: hypothetical protein EOS06_08385 [Mesorhizobium sp.]TIL96100.1 MAG: hypothetical protein E5Y73_02815 [Mesorhizobium sp.]TIM11287.1 MAG: hypothetical protein E5Y62_04565 [Mesorhizobium sp.]TIM12668.1 MAG: hypothetical protein E5Y67_21445 [Mesorhizobium sp.]TIN40858.1 MAG: hypothetical protein E5Y13_08605 [Mesorhizobium sp.]